LSQSDNRPAVGRDRVPHYEQLRREATDCPYKKSKST
jgi:hypothetical protein